MRIDCDFPGGNVTLVEVDDDEVIIAPDTRDTEGRWFWWYFRASDVARDGIQFVFSTPGVVGTSGIAVSRDGGGSWEWHADVSRGSGWMPEAFFYRHEEAAGATTDLRFAFAIPYLEANWTAFLAARGGCPWITRRALCTSKQGRSVYQYLVGNQDEAPRHRMLLTARHHACESPPNFVLEGIIDHAITSDWFQENVQILTIPFMDADGVEAGDQGKNRRPWDHNRDYGVETIYPEVKAVKDLVPAWAGSCLDISLDLHAPGRTDDFFHMVGQQDPRQWEQVTRFSTILARQCESDGCDLQVDPARNVPWGTGWNRPDTTGVQRSHASWIGSLGIARLCTTLEVPYGSVLGVPVTPERLRAFGHVLARACEAYLKRGKHHVPPARDDR